MRSRRLALLEGKRIRVHGTVKRFGTSGKGGRDGRRVLLAPVVAEDGTPLAEHMWIVVTRAMSDLDPKPGTVIAFDGRVHRYRHVTGGEDLELARPSRVAVVAMPAPRRGPSPAEQLRARLKAAGVASGIAAHLLTRVQRILCRGADADPAEWYAALLEAHWAVGTTRAALFEMAALIDRLDTAAPDPIGAPS